MKPNFLKKNTQSGRIKLKKNPCKKVEKQKDER